MNAQAQHIVEATLVLTKENLQLLIPTKRLDPGDLIVLVIDGVIRVFTPDGTIFADSKKILLREKTFTQLEDLSHEDQIPACLQMG